LHEVRVVGGGTCPAGYAVLPCQLPEGVTTVSPRRYPVKRAIRFRILRTAILAVVRNPKSSRYFRGICIPVYPVSTSGKETMPVTWCFFNIAGRTACRRPKLKS